MVFFSLLGQNYLQWIEERFFRHFLLVFLPGPSSQQAQSYRTKRVLLPMIPEMSHAANVYRLNIRSTHTVY